MANLPIVKITGLHTNNSELSEVPNGSLADCNNIVIDKNSVAEQRRGFAIYGDAMGTSPSADVAKQFFVYKDRLLRHFSSTLEYDNGSGTFSEFDGSFSETQTGLKLRGLEKNGNFFFTSSTGIKKISAATASDFTTSVGYITNAGGIKALDMDLSLNSQAGFLTSNSKVAYRIVWGIKDAATNLVLGVPSQRAVIENSLSLSLIKDFNNLLAILDEEAALGGGQELSDTDYISTLKIPASFGASASTLRTNLIALASKLEDDLNTVAEPTFTRTTTSGELTSNVATITFSSSIPSWLTTGTEITVSGLTGVLTPLNGTFTVSSTGASTVSYALTNPDIAVTADTNGVVKQHEFTALTEPAALSTNPTTIELEALEDYYNDIVTLLQAEPSSKIGNNSTTTPFDNSFSTQSATTNVRFTVPDNVTTAHFYQIYRTAVTRAEGGVTLDDVDPGDEMGLVYEGNPTGAEISAREVTVHDIVPESFRGANLYTNPQSGEGILQANEAPPLAKDIAEFKNTIFYANTQTRQKLQFSLLGVSNISPGTSTFIISDGTSTETYNFASPVAQEVEVQTVADNSGDLAGTYFTVDSPTTSYYVWYKVSGSGTDPLVSGKTGIQVDIVTNDSANDVASATQVMLERLNDFSVSVLTDTITILNVDSGIAPSPDDGTSGFTVTVTTAGEGEDASTQTILKSGADTPAQQVDETARSLVKIINKQSSGLVYAQYLSGSTDVPGSILLESRDIEADAFYLYCDDATDTGLSFSPALPDNTVIGYETQVISDNEVAPNRIYYSKLQQPEAVPLVNYFDVGPKDDEILRILPLRDSLFILKRSGIYRLSGEGGTSGFSVALFDNTTSVLAPNTAVVLDNKVYAFCDQGVVAISDTGVLLISRPIENLLNPLPLHTNFEAVSFGVGYESDRAYLLWVTSDNSDSYPTQCFRFNTLTQAWTKWEISKTCGITKNNILYVGAADTNYIEKERKSYTRLDYCDREYTKTLGANAVSGTEITLPSASNIRVGDVLLQTQYLTIYRYNQLLEKLDLDNGVADDDYYDTLYASPGDSLRNKLTDLATKLDADSGIVYTSFSSDISAYTSSFEDTQDAYNDIVDVLNVDTGVQFNNYILSTGTTTYEAAITDLDTRFFIATLQYELPLILGDVVTLEHIPTSLTWNVQAFDDPEQFKHISEGKIIFDHTNFSTATVSYSSDVSPAFEEIEFNKQGNGIFGYTSDEESNFGGFADKSPFRTLIPRNKQRCRYLKTKFDHAVAREKYALFGYSLVYQSYSTRPYRD